MRQRVGPRMGRGGHVHVAPYALQVVHRGPQSQRVRGWRQSGHVVAERVQLGQRRVMVRLEEHEGARTVCQQNRQ